MANITNELFTKICMEEGEEWMDIECDGCSALLGALPENEYNEKELYLCGECDHTCCSYTRLEQVDPIKYADEIKKQKDSISISMKYIYTAAENARKDVDDSNIPF